MRCSSSPCSRYKRVRRTEGLASPLRLHLGVVLGLSSGSGLLCLALSRQAGSEFGSGIALSVAGGETPRRFGDACEQRIEPGRLVVRAELTVRRTAGRGVGLRCYLGTRCPLGRP